MTKKDKFNAIDDNYTQIWIS